MGKPGHRSAPNCRKIAAAMEISGTKSRRYVHPANRGRGFLHLQTAPDDEGKNRTPVRMLLGCDSKICVENSGGLEGVQPDLENAVTLRVE